MLHIKKNRYKKLPKKIIERWYEKNSHNQSSGKGIQRSKSKKANQVADKKMKREKYQINKKNQLPKKISNS